MRSFTLAGIACFICISGAFADTDVSGNWSGILGGPMIMVLKQDGSKLSGSIGPSVSNQILEFQDGKVDGDALAFHVGKFEVHLKLEGEELRGEVIGPDGTMKAYLKRVQPTRPDLKFEVASVKLLPPVQGGYSSSMSLDPGRLTCSNVTLRKLIVNSYDVRDYQLQGPDWINSELYSVVATMPKGTSGDEVMVMVQNLLADRFGLVLRHETREQPVYALVQGKTGSKMKPAEFGRSSTNTSPGKIEGKSVPLQNLSNILSRMVDHPVIDMTGLKGVFDFTLEWTPDAQADKSDATPGQSIFTAIQEQLGLKLEPRKAPVDVLVVDRANKVPVEN